jgi:hypothetical protein
MPALCLILLRGRGSQCKGIINRHCLGNLLTPKVLSDNQVVSEKEDYMKESERFKDLKGTLAREYKMNINDPKFQSIYDAAELMAGNLGYRALDRFFNVFYTLMKPYF